MSWLDPVRAALDDLEQPVAVFFRDDDAGWGDAQLAKMLDRFGHHGVPIDLAVIPTELTPPLAASLIARAATAELHLHQHGFAHRNHEPTGRKYELGPARSITAQAADVKRGKELLARALGDLVEPIFTPPWNRCTGDTGEVLAELGFRVLSRDHTAPPLGRADLVEVPVTIDWFGQTKGIPWSRTQLAARIVESIGAGGAVGVMLHHAVTDTNELAAIDELLALVASHPAVTSTTILEVAVGVGAAG